MDGLKELLKDKLYVAAIIVFVLRLIFGGIILDIAIIALAIALVVRFIKKSKQNKKDSEEW